MLKIKVTFHFVGVVLFQGQRVARVNLSVIECSPHGASAFYHISASPLLLILTASSSLSTPIHPHLQTISTYPESFQYNKLMCNLFNLALVHVNCNNKLALK